MNSKSTNNPCRKPCDLQQFSYKLTCELLWDLDCGMHLNKTENKKLMNQFYSCLKKRQDFRSQCIKKVCWDAGHQGAIDKMQNKVNFCQHIISLQ